MSTTVNLQQNALITYDNVREYLRQVGQSDQNLVKREINVVSDFFENYCRRILKGRKIWNEIHRNVSKVLLKAYPLQKIPTINTGYDVKHQTGTADAGGSTTNLIDNALTEASDYWNGGMLSVELSSNSWEKAQIDNFDAASDTVTVQSRDAFSESVAEGDSYEIMLWNKSSYYTLTESDYVDIDYDSGIITLGGSYGTLVVDYYGGFQTVPDDIQQAAIFQVLENMNPAGNVNSQGFSIGGHSTQFRQGEDLQGMNQKVKMVLDSYRDRFV